MKKLLFAALIAAAAHTGVMSFADDAEKTAPVKLLCIGDSITEGRGAPGMPVCYSWRYSLWKKLLDRGANVEFAGFKNTNFDGNVDYPPHKGQTFNNRHSAWWGYRLRRLAMVDPGRGDQTDFLANIAKADFDIVMMCLGTNDPNEGPVAFAHGQNFPEEEWPDHYGTPENLEKWYTVLIEGLRKKNPKAKFVIMAVQGPWMDATRNAPFKAIAEKLNTEDSPVVYAPRPANWIAPPDAEGTHTHDWVHPNAKGDDAIADEVVKVLYEKKFLNE